MKNVSLKGENLELFANKFYYVIDPLYILDIKDNLEILNLETPEKDIKNKIFKYCDFPFCKVFFVENFFEIKQIKKVKFENTDPNEFNIITDSGMLLVCEYSCFFELVKDFDYNFLISSEIEIINIEYVKKLNDKYSYVGLILSPGIGSGYDFDGSGLFKLEIPPTRRSIKKRV